MGNNVFSCLYKCCTNMAHNVKGGEKLTMLQSRERPEQSHDHAQERDYCQDKKQGRR